MEKTIFPLASYEKIAIVLFIKAILWRDGRAA